MTLRSCMACSSAACVFGGARLISSASTMLREDRPRRKPKRALAGRAVLLHQLGAGDVARHEVGRELHAREGEVERLRDGLHEQRLREARHADEHDVSAGEQRGDEVVDDVRLSDDALGDLLRERARACGETVEQREVVRVVGAFTVAGHECSGEMPSARCE